jgi:ABC-type uncharacterized transport system substrate-binding protein
VRRREFITLVGSVAAWPLAVHAQQAAMPAIGFLSSLPLDAITDRLRGFRQGLKHTGYVEGENVAIVYRFAENQDERLPTLAAELVSRRVAVIATLDQPSTFAATAATTTIPIVFNVGDDPVRLGLVTSLARPGGNITSLNLSHLFRREVFAHTMAQNSAPIPPLLKADMATLAFSASKDGKLRDARRMRRRQDRARRATHEATFEGGDP